MKTKMAAHEVESRLIQHYKDKSVPKPSVEEYAQEGRDSTIKRTKDLTRARTIAGATMFGGLGALGGAAHGLRASLGIGALGALAGAGLMSIKNKKIMARTNEYVNSPAFDLKEHAAYNRLSNVAHGAYSKKAEFVMDKIAANDTRPKPGFFAKVHASNRALKTEQNGKTNRFLMSEELAEKYRNIKGEGKAALIGGGIGAAVGAAGFAALGGGLKDVGKGALLTGTLGALTGANAAWDRGARKARIEYLRERGITRNHGLQFTPEAAKKYIHKKYQGGGWDPETRTSH